MADLREPGKPWKDGKHQGKERMSLVPQNALRQVARVMTYGAHKYANHNYLVPPGLTPEELIDAALRHVNDWIQGEDINPESDLHHLSHAAASCMMALEVIGEYSQDSRFKGKLWRYVSK